MSYPSKSEVLILIIGLTMWLAINLVTADRGPTIWHDEVMFSDAAVRWLSGRGFTSTAWAQPPDTPAVLNGPLYTMLLAGWLRIWGVGPTAVRSFSFVLGGIVAVWLWWLSLRLDIVRTPWLRLAGVATFLCSLGVSYGYRSARYDMVGLLLVLAIVTVVIRATSTQARQAQE